MWIEETYTIPALIGIHGSGGKGTRLPANLVPTLAVGVAQGGIVGSGAGTGIVGCEFRRSLRGFKRRDPCMRGDCHGV
jgi:hypothetical protein